MWNEPCIRKLSVSQRIGKTSVQFAAYTDHVHNLVLTGAGDPTSYSDDVLPDVYSGTFSYALNGALNTTGMRLVIERKISDDLSATFDYSNGGAVTGETLTTWQNLAQDLKQSWQQSVATRFQVTCLRPAHAGLPLINGPAETHSPPWMPSTLLPDRWILT